LFLPDGRRIVSAGNDKVIRLWDVTTGKDVRQLGGHEDRVTKLSVSPDGRRLACAAGDGAIRIWGLAAGQLQVICRRPDVYCVAFSPDGEYILSGGKDRTIRLWDATTGRELREWKANSFVVDLSFSPDGKLALSAGVGRPGEGASAGAEFALRLYEVETGKEV